MKLVRPTMAACLGSLLLFGASAQADPETEWQELQSVLAITPNDLELLLKVSKASADLAEGALAKSRAELALSSGRQAVALAPKDARAHFAVARACGKLTDSVSSKQKLELSKTIREEASQAVKLDPTHDEAWHLLGRWHFGVANINPLLKGLAEIIYGGMPEASNQEALKCLLKASRLAPRKISHHSELARIYTQLGQKDAAAAEWKSVLGLTPVNASDREDLAEAKTKKTL